MDKVEIKAKDGLVSTYRGFLGNAAKELRHRPYSSGRAFKGL